MTSNDSTMQQKLNEHFPVPALPPSQLSPQRFPGANLESLAALKEVLKDNHERHHIFLNELKFHNHTTHRALATYALGGPAAVIREHYKRDSLVQRPVIPSPEPITEENFVDHLGDEKYYQSYITFFSKQITKQGAARTLEEFVFSEKYNLQNGRNANTQPEMFSRLFTSLLHPLIHIGHGIEFGLKGMFVEGLALTAVDDLTIRDCFPPSFFSPGTTNGIEHHVNRVPSLALNALETANVPAISKTGGVHAFDIVARILNDDRLQSSVTTPADFISKFRETFVKLYKLVRQHSEQWTVDLNRPDEIERKLEEVIWLSSMLYGVSGLTPNGPQLDFFLMHMVTSSLFIPSWIAYLSPRSQVLLLRGYLSTVLTWWVMCGRPALNIKSFMTTTSVEPSTPETTETTLVPNPFLPILQSAITHPIEHYVKIQRAFAHFNTLYGRRPAGYFRGTELEGAELLDGSLFLRASLLTANHIGYVREGEEPKEFSIAGYFA